MKKSVSFQISNLTAVLLLSFASPCFSLTITAPHDGDNYYEGETVRVVAELDSSDTKKIGYVSILITGLDGMCRDRLTTHPRYECSFKIPSSSPRNITISAFAVTDSAPIISQPVHINVKLPPSLALQGLKSINGNMSFLSRIGEQEQLYIMGVYSDGERELWKASAGTTYTSSNEKIAEVSVNGLITAKAKGTAQITVRNGTRKLVINVVVEPTQ